MRISLFTQVRPTASAAVRWTALLMLPAFFASVAGAQDGSVVAVYASASPAYHRTRQPDGSYRPETYAFGEGGSLAGVGRDFTIDRLKFIDVARMIAPALAAQNYLPCDPKNPEATRLLIMVYWGTTAGTDDTASSPQYEAAQSLIPPPMLPPPRAPDGALANGMTSDPSMSGMGTLYAQRTVRKAAAESALDESTALTSLANRQRDRQDARNAAVLGYLPELERVSGYQMTALAGRRQDVLSEVEESRYFVVLLAYDFPLLLNHKQRKLMWEARYSVPERGHDFGKELAGISKTAARYFGRDSDGLRRATLRGVVKLGDLKVMDEDVNAKK